MIVAQSLSLGGTGYQPVAAGNLPAVLSALNSLPSVLSSVALAEREALAKEGQLTQLSTIPKNRKATQGNASVFRYPFGFNAKSRTTCPRPTLQVPVQESFVKSKIKNLKSKNIEIYPQNMQFHPDFCLPQFSPKTLKSHPISRCGSMGLELNRGNSREKNPEFFTRHFDGKPLKNQAKTIENMSSKCRKNTQVLTRFLQLDSGLWRCLVLNSPPCLSLWAKAGQLNRLSTFHGAHGTSRFSWLTPEEVVLRCGRESQFEPESTERAAAVTWRGGRVLICIQYFIKPHRPTRRWGFCLVKQERRRHNY
jgi:hypothetical protein